jgi:hypothetical protein
MTVLRRPIGSSEPRLRGAIPAKINLSIGHPEVSSRIQDCALPVLQRSWSALLGLQLRPIPIGSATTASTPAAAACGRFFRLRRHTGKTSTSRPVCLRRWVSAGAPMRRRVRFLHLAMRRQRSKRRRPHVGAVSRGHNCCALEDPISIRGASVVLREMLANSETSSTRAISSLGPVSRPPTPSISSFTFVRSIPPPR